VGMGHELQLYGRDRERGLCAHPDADHSAGAIHRMDARNGPAPLERGSVLTAQWRFAPQPSRPASPPLLLVL
jgi:hypothetical protein